MQRQSRTVVNPNTKFDDSDAFMLTDLDSQKSLMMIPCDTAGNFSWTGVTRAPLQRNAMQTSNTSNQYSDLEPPWISIPQDDWTGGRGNYTFTKDTTRYYDGKRCQAAFNSCIYNAPMEHYSEGFRYAETNYPGSVNWRKLNAGQSFLVATITCGLTFDVGEVYTLFRRRGTPKHPLTVMLYNQNETLTASHDFTLEEVPDTLSEFLKFTVSDFEMTVGETYTLMLTSADGDIENYWEIGCNGEVPYFRVAETQEGYRSIFFTYEQLQFMVRQKPNGTPTLWMNGEICEVRTQENYTNPETLQTNTNVVNIYKHWEPNQWAGARIGLVYGAGVEGQVSVWRTIVSNTETEITVDEPWDITPVNNDTVFIIVDTPVWQQISAPLLTHFVTDVEVIHGQVFFCMSEKENVEMQSGAYKPYRREIAFLKMRLIFHPGNSASNFHFRQQVGTPNGYGATYLKAVRDSSGMMLWRARNDGTDNQRIIDRMPLHDWTSYSVYWKRTSALEVSDREVIIKTDGGENYADFGIADKDFSQYKIVVTGMSSDNRTGRLTITLEGADLPAQTEYKVIASITIRNSGTFYLDAHCPYQYRRIAAQITGTNAKVSGIEVYSGESYLVDKFFDPIILKDNYGKITGLFEYGTEQYKSLWVMQEGMLSSVNKVDGTTDTYTLDRINIDELATTAEEWNGKSANTADVYLLWGWLNGLQRYYNTQLEGKGPDHDEGLPFERQGRITQIVSYPSNLFISIDGGEEGFSTIMQFNQSGWHELYRAPNKGERIFDMSFQPIYGERPDRLWVQVGDDVIWLAMPSKILYALQDRNAEYTHESVLVSAWHTAGMTDVEKLWQTLKIMADFLDGVNCWVEADYQIDEETEWHPIRNLYTISPSQKEELNPDKSTNGKKLRYRLRLQTTDMHKTPKVNVVVLEAVGRVDIKQSYNFYFRNIKYKRDLNAEFEDIEPLEVQDLLDEWANGLKKLRLNSRWKIFDNKIVYLDAVQTSVLNELSEGYIGQITLNEL